VTANAISGEDTIGVIGVKAGEYVAVFVGIPGADEFAGRVV
jgi:hypothetical protein